MVRIVRDIPLVEQRSENILHTYTLDRPADSCILDRLDNWRQVLLATLERRLPAEVPTSWLQAKSPAPQLSVGALAQPSR
jgi:hypothetical protein